MVEWSAVRRSAVMPILITGRPFVSLFQVVCLTNSIHYFLRQLGHNMVWSHMTPTGRTLVKYLKQKGDEGKVMSRRQTKLLGSMP